MLFFNFEKVSCFCKHGPVFLLSSLLVEFSIFEDIADNLDFGKKGAIKAVFLRRILEVYEPLMLSPMSNMDFLFLPKPGIPRASKLSLFIYVNAGFSLIASPYVLNLLTLLFA